MLFVFKTFASFFLLLGLLKFGLDAPNLIKTIIGGADDLLKGKFNGLANFGSIKEDVKKGWDTAKKGATTAGGAIAAPFIGGYKLGKGVAKVGGTVGGGVSGMVAGGKEGGFMGAVRGMVVGGKQGGQTPGHAIKYGGIAGGQEGALYNKHAQAFANASSDLGANTDMILNTKKVAIDKAKAKKEQAEQNYNARVNDYISQNREIVTNSISTNAGGARDSALDAYEDDYKKKAIKDYAKRHKMTEAQVNADASAMSAINANAATARASMSTADKEKELIEWKLKHDAEENLKPGFEQEKSECEVNIAALEASAIRDNKDATNRTIDEFFNSQSNWGEDFREEYSSKLDSEMHSATMNKEIASTINSVLQKVNHTGPNTVYAGDVGAGTKGTISDKNIKDIQDRVNGLLNNSSRTAAQEEELYEYSMALSQIMKNMKTASNKAYQSYETSSKSKGQYLHNPSNKGGSK